MSKAVRRTLEIGFVVILLAALMGGRSLLPGGRGTVMIAADLPPHLLPLTVESGGESTPLTAEGAEIDLPLGAHTIALTHPSFAPVSRAIEIQSRDQRLRLTATLTNGALTLHR